LTLFFPSTSHISNGLSRSRRGPRLGSLTRSYSLLQFRYIQFGGGPGPRVPSLLLDPEQKKVFLAGFSPFKADRHDAASSYRWLKVLLPPLGVVISLMSDCSPLPPACFLGLLHHRSPSLIRDCCMPRPCAPRVFGFGALFFGPFFLCCPNARRFTDFLLFRE